LHSVAKSALAMIFTVLILATPLLSPAFDATLSLTGDDECLTGDEQCGFNALQLKGEFKEDNYEAEEVEVELDENWHSAPDGLLAKLCSGGHGWCVMGRPAPYMIVAGKSSAVGMESINGGNVGYFNSMMNAAWSHCGGSNCVLITNPRGFRTQSRFHIHFRHMNGHGHHLKQQMEQKVCKSGGWHKGGFPCGGKAKYFHGHPAVFSSAMSAGGLGGAGVTVWPGACGGGGAIILVTYHCSIEHSVAIIPPH